MLMNRRLNNVLLSTLITGVNNFVFAICATVFYVALVAMRLNTFQAVTVVHSNVPEIKRHSDGDTQRYSI